MLYLPTEQKTISQLGIKHPQKKCYSEDILISGSIKKDSI